MSLAAAAKLATAAVSHEGEADARNGGESEPTFEFAFVRDLAPPTKMREVRLCRDRNGGLHVCKTFLKRSLESKSFRVKPGMTSKRSGKALVVKETQVAKVKREIAIMKRLQHENVARVSGGG